MTLRTAAALPLLLLVAACGTSSSDLVGKWREPSGSEFEFFKDGTVNIGGSSGARYTVTEAGLQFETQMGGPRTMPMEMFGDSMIISQPDGVDKVTFYRNPDGKRPIEYKMAADERPFTGTCSETSKYGGKRESENIAVGFRGSLVLDDVTRSFRFVPQRENLSTHHAYGQTELRGAGWGRTSYAGRFTEENGTLTLHRIEPEYRGGAKPQPSDSALAALWPLTVKREGDRLVIDGETMFKLEIQHSDFHTSDSFKNHTPVWNKPATVAFTAVPAK